MDESVVDLPQEPVSQEQEAPPPTEPETAVEEASPEEVLKKEYEELKEKLQCTICLDIFKKPVVILPCLHSFCSPCIASHISTSSRSTSLPSSPPTSSSSEADSSSSSSSSSSSPNTSETDPPSPASPEPSPIICKCPVCRREFDPTEGKGGVQENPFFDSQVDRLGQVRRALEKITGLSTELELCDVCDPPDRGDASVRCLDCNQNLCEGCNKFHMKFNKTHKVIDMHEASQIAISSSSSPTPPKHLPCPHHASKELDLMCLICAVPVCSYCAFDGNHNGHEALPIFKVVHLKKEELSALVEIMDGCHKNLDKSLSLVDLMETKIQKDMASQKARILTFLENFRKVLDQKEKELLNDLQTSSDTKLKMLNQQRKQLETDISCLENSVGVSRSFLKNASDDQFSFHFRLLSDQLTRFKEDKNLLQIPVDTRNLELDEGQLIDLEDLLKGTKVVEKKPAELYQALKDLRISFFTRLAARAAPRDYSTVALPLRVIGSHGAANGFFYGPYRLAVDINNRIVVCDTNYHRIQIFDDQGIHIHTIGGNAAGAGVGQFSSPQGVAVDYNNRIVVTDTNNHRIQIFDDQGNHIHTFGSNGVGAGQFNAPQGVAVDLNNRIIVTDTNNHRIQIFDDQGNHIHTFGSNGANNGQFSAPQGLAVDLNNRIIVCDTNYHRIQIFDDQGIHIHTFGSNGANNGQFSAPRGVAVDLNNRIIVCDTGYNRIQIFDDQGIHQKSFGAGGASPGQFNGPFGIAVDLDNRIIVSEINNHRIQIF